MVKCCNKKYVIFLNELQFWEVYKKRRGFNDDDKRIKWADNDSDFLDWLMGCETLNFDPIK